MSREFDYVNEAYQFIASRIGSMVPDVALVLGSSQGEFASRIEDATTIPYEQIPHFPRSTVAGHAGELKIGTIGGKSVAMFAGRVHMYEGYSAKEVVFPVRILKPWGIGKLVLTNAAGGLNPDFSVGDFMLITDHLNLMGRNPLVGPNSEEFGVRFPDMTNAYDPELNQLVCEVARSCKIDLKKGVYAAMLGPSYETPAEIGMLRVLGADAVGMSTVPEVIAARHQGVKVVGISMITNLAAGISKEPLSHEEVKQAGLMVKDKMFELLEGIIKGI